VVAHVRGPAGPDVFWDLATLRPGDRVIVRGRRGRARFVVVSLETVLKEQLPYDRIWPDTDESLLRLITCGGTPDPNGAGFPANTIVYLRRA
jgi:sortase (surface protein transpeptidase)